MSQANLRQKTLWGKIPRRAIATEGRAQVTKATSRVLALERRTNARNTKELNSEATHNISEASRFLMPEHLREENP